MPKRSEGFLDNGHGEPLADIAAVATILGTDTVVDTTMTDDEGHWLFADLPTSDEYLITLSDTAGNAVSRAPWSGEMRELWVRDRLDVAGVPLVLDPAVDNSLAWTATGLYAPPAPETDLTDYYTKTEADARYAELTDVDPFPQYLTSAEADALFLTPAEGNAAYATSAHNHDTTYVQLTGGSVMTGLLGPSTHNTRDLGTAALRWRKLWAVDGEFTNVPTVGGTSLDSRYSLAAHDHNTAYVQLTGGSVMTGLLGPTTTNTRDLGTSALRWRSIYLDTSVEFGTAVSDQKLVLYPGAVGVGFYLGIRGGTLWYNAGQATNKHSFGVANVERASISDTAVTAMVPVMPSAHNTLDLGSSSVRWQDIFGMTGDFTTSLTVATKPLVISPDGSNIVEWRANGLYAAAGAVSDIWVNTTGDTMTGDLNMTANVLPTVTNVRSLGSTSLRWLKVWATDADFTNAPTVGGSALLTATAAGALYEPLDSAYTKSESDTAFVNVGGDTMTGPLVMTSDLDGTSNTMLTLTHAFAGIPGARLQFLSSRGTVASPAATVANDEAFRLLFRGRGNSAYADAGSLDAYADLVNAASNIIQGRMQINTANSAGVLTERLRADGDGRVWIGKLNNQGTLMTLGPQLILQRQAGAHAETLLAQAGMSGGDHMWGVMTSRGTLTAPTTLESGGAVLGIHGYAYNAGWRRAGAFELRVGGTPGASWSPGEYRFILTDTAGTERERLRIAADGLVHATSTFQINSRPVIMAGCRVTYTANFAVATATDTVLNFNAERFDTDNFHDIVTNNSRLTVPAGLAGKYDIKAHVGFAANGTGMRQVMLRVNGVTGIAYQVVGAVTGFIQLVSVATTYDLAVGDYVQCLVYQTSGGNLDVLTLGNSTPEFMMQRIG